MKTYGKVPVLGVTLRRNVTAWLTVQALYIGLKRHVTLVPAAKLSVLNSRNRI